MQVTESGLQAISRIYRIFKNTLKNLAIPYVFLKIVTTVQSSVVDPEPELEDYDNYDITCPFPDPDPTIYQLFKEIKKKVQIL
jgi:hypothetical protein